MSASITTTLYEKLFIDGFQKPSYVVASLLLERPASEPDIAAAVRRTLAFHPRLRSVVRMRFGVPFELVPSAPADWAGMHVHDGATDLRALEERLLATPLDVSRTHPLEVHLVREPAAMVLKVHHAVLDASSGFAVLRDFAHALDGSRGRGMPRRARGPASRCARLRDWLTHVQLRPRLPEASIVASFRPESALEQTPVAYVERLLPRAYAEISRRARARGATFSELVASALLSAMGRYNDTHVSTPPASVGLMLARARPRRSSGDAAFRADTCVVSASREQLRHVHHRTTLAELRRRANENRHNDLALAALYARRKVLGRSPPPPNEREETAISFTLSDLTAFGRVLARTSGALPITGVRVLASPTSFDHAGMLLTRFDDDVRLAIVAHRGAFDADELLALTLAHLEER